MQQLIVRGDPGIRKDAVIDYDGEEQVCFSIQRQGDYHGPEEVQLWCTSSGRRTSAKPSRSASTSPTGSTWSRSTPTRSTWCRRAVSS